MKVATYKGYTLAILTRNEHCPPHVHVGTADWEARFKFSFWHDDVCLWDVVPVQKAPKLALLEQLRQTLMKPANLRKARERWWQGLQRVCLENLMWQPTTQDVVSPKSALPGARKIVSARFEAVPYKTVLQLGGHPEPVEIEHDDP